MYINTVSRYLGNGNAAAPMPNAARLAELSKPCAKKWKQYKKQHGKNFPYRWRAFLAANPICREGIAIRWGYQPPLSPCQDANTGLLIDCWDAALQKGVNLNGMRGLGDMLSQPQLTAASKAYGNMSHARQKALRNPTGYVFNGTRMVRNRNWGLGRYLGRFGQDDSSIDFLPSGSLDITTTPIFSDPTSYGTGLGPLANEPAYSPTLTTNPVLYADATLPTYGPLAPGLGPSTYGTAPGYNPITGTTSSVSPISSIASLFAPIAQAVANATTPTGTAARPATGLSTQGAIISGVPNIILYAMGGFLVLVLLMGNQGRR